MASVDHQANISPSLLDRLVDDDPLTSSPFFTAAHVKNQAGLIKKFASGKDTLSVVFREKFSATFREKLKGYDGSPEFLERLQPQLLEELNRLIDGDPLYDPDRLKGVRVPEEVQRLMEDTPKGKALIRVNRLLLEAAYPTYFLRSRKAEPAFTLRQLKHSVSRDLEAMLNTRRELLEELPSGYKEIQNSILNYGLPDFTGFSLQSAGDQKYMRRVVEQTIVTFEPRLKSVKVTVEQQRDHDPNVRFTIDALLQVDPAPEPVTFDAVLELNTSEYHVKGID